MKTKVMLDIDGVLGDFYSGFANFLNNNFNTKLDLTTEPSAYSISSWGHLLDNSTVDKAILDWIISGGYFEIPIYNEAKKFVYNLMDKYDVYIVTARVGDFSLNIPNAVKEIIKKDTMRWFKHHGIPCDKLFFEHKKTDFCLQNGINILIEDKMQTAVGAADQGLVTVLIDRGWNRNSVSHPNIKVARDYTEAIDILKEISNE